MVIKMKKNIIIVLLFAFIQNMLNNLGHPVTPSFVRYLEIPEYMFGVFFATMSLGMMLAAPIWGSLGDSGKNKNYIFIGMIVYSIGQIGFGFANNQYLMILFRFISGIGIAAPMTLFVALLIGHSGKSRTKNLAIFAALATLGTSLGYQLGGILGDSVFFNKLIVTPSYQNVFLFQGISFILFGIMVLIFVKDYNKDVSFSKKKNPFASLAKIKTLDKKLIIFLISLTMITIGSTNVSKYIDVYFDDLNLTTTALGNFVLATGLVSVATSIFIVPFFSKLRKQLVFIILIQVLSSVIIFYVFRANNFILTVYTVFMIYVIFKAIYLPLEQNYISRQADDDSIGTVMGIRQSFLSIGNVIGPLFGGMLYGIKPLVLFDSSGIFFLIGGFLLLIVLIIQKRETKLEN